MPGPRIRCSLYIYSVPYRGDKDTRIASLCRNLSSSRNDKEISLYIDSVPPRSDKDTRLTSRRVVATISSVNDVEKHSEKMYLHGVTLLHGRHSLHACAQRRRICNRETHVS